MSAAFLSQAERGKATPSIVSLVNISRALETDIHYFITPPAPTSLVRRADKPVYVEIDSPITYKRLDASIRNQRMNAHSRTKSYDHLTGPVKEEVPHLPPITHKSSANLRPERKSKNTVY